MQEDALKWNQKHLEHPMPQSPSDLLVHFMPLLKKQKYKYALDLACGNGRNSKFLAKNGFECEGVDISDIALQMSEGTKNLHLICTDLDNFRPAPNRYDVILNFYFLNRDLFPSIIHALKAGGIFMLETFIKEADGFNSSQIIDEKILEHNELDEIFSDFRILHKQSSYITRREGMKAKIISFVAQKP